MGFLWMLMILIGIGFSNYQLNYIFLEKKILILITGNSTFSNYRHFNAYITMKIFQIKPRMALVV